MFVICVHVIKQNCQKQTIIYAEYIIIYVAKEATAESVIYFVLYNNFEKYICLYHTIR